jgi:hypothetical protein
LRREIAALFHGRNRLLVRAVRATGPVAGTARSYKR